MFGLEIEDEKGRGGRLTLQTSFPCLESNSSFKKYSDLEYLEFMKGKENG